MLVNQHTSPMVIHHSPNMEFAVIVRSEGGASLVGGEQVNAYSQLLAEQDPLQF